MYFYFTFVLVTFLLLAMLIIERRTMLLGFVFILWAATFAFTLTVLFETYHLNSLFVLIVAVILILFIGFPFYFISFILALITSGMKLIKKEGKKLRNLLSLLLGITVLVWVFIIPFFVDRITHPIAQGIFGLISFSVSYFVFLMLCFSISSWVNLQRIPFKSYDFIIVLGSGLIGKRVPPLLASRIEKGIALFKKHHSEKKPVKIIFTGGKGADEEIAEGKAMANYAIEKGMEQKHILIEDQAVNTYENLLFSKTLIEKDVEERDLKRKYHAILVTSNFHVFRSLLWSRKVNLACDGAGAKTKFYFWINALIREFIGVLYMHRKFHMIVLLLALLFCILLTIVNIHFVLPYEY